MSARHLVPLALFVALGGAIAYLELFGNGAARPEPPAGSERKAGASPHDPASLRDPALWPFSSDSPWNTAIGDGARYADAQHPCTRDVTDPRVTAWINAAEWSHPVHVARSSDPLRGIFRDGKLLLRIHVPIYARPALPETEESDGHLHIIDPGRQVVDEMWRARLRKDGDIDVDGYTRNSLHGPGVGKGGERAYGGSALGGLIRAFELRTGIPHALALAVPRSKLRRGPVWPAIYEDSFAEKDYKGSVPMGQLVAIPPAVDVEALRLSREGRIIARALRDYGAYIVDASADFSLSAEPELEPELEKARSDMSTIRQHLRCVLNNGPTQVGGGGRRRAPPAPPLRGAEPAP